MTVTLLLAGTLLATSPARGQTSLVPAGAVWRYDDSGTDRGTTWRAPAYDDSAWKTGLAQLGYGDGDEATVIGYGPNASNKYPTYYFRRAFTADPSQYASLKLRVVRDDGCVVYLNGVEVARSNMPTGTIVYTTWSAAVVGGSDESAWFEFPLDPEVLVQAPGGTNVIAVEIHQCNATSSDLSFDLEILGLPPIPAVTLVSPADHATINSTTATLTASITDAVGLMNATLYLGSAPNTVVLGGAGDSVDAEIRADAPTTRYGAATIMKVDGQSPHAHSVIRFPALIGTGPNQVRPFATVVSATIEFQCSNASPNVAKIYRLIQDWDEATVTWNERSAGVPWSAPGTDSPYSRDESVALDASCTATGNRTFNITQIVQAWCDQAPNHGFVIVDTGTDGIDLATRESATPPVLTVQYRPGFEPIETQPLEGTSATVTFTAPVEDVGAYSWNVFVMNQVGQGGWAPADRSFTVDVSTPGEAVLVGPADGATGVELAPTLAVDVSDPNGDSLAVTFYGRTAAAAEDFTIVVLPDTQNYSQYYPEIFTEQTAWIVAERESRNIVFVTHLGDVVNDATSTTQYDNANTSLGLLDPAVAYGLCPGNHDLPTTLYNQYFPWTRYASRPWYGGHYPSDGNDSSYQLFSAAGMDLIAIHLTFCPTSDVIGWADGVLKAYPERIAMITTHGYIDGSGNRTVHQCADTSAIWNQLVVPNDNVRFVLCGHVAAEYLRTDFVDGRAVYQMLSDYQGRANGGDGWLRMLRFAPEDDKVYVETYSPHLDQYERDANSEFALDLPMGGSFAAIGTVTGVSSGSTASLTWPDLEPSTGYSWYAVVTDPTGRTSTSAVWSFTTGSGDSTPPIISGVEVADVTGSTATVTWTTNEPATSTVEYGLDAGYGSSVSDATLVTAHTVALAGLEPGTPYHFRVSSADVAENLATGDDGTFATSFPPTAVDDAAVTDEDVPVIIDVLANDFDADGDTLVLTSAGLATSGSVVLNQDGTVAYTPEANFNGSDSFTYTVSDGRGGTDSATVTVAVSPVNDPPVAADGLAAGDEDTAIAVSLDAIDPDDDPLTYAILSGPAHGTLTGTAPSLIFMPEQDYNGTDSFTFKANDRLLDSNVATVTITVDPVNDPPVAVNDAATTPEDTQVTILVLANDSDIDRDALAVSGVTDGAHGTVSTNGTTVVYAPALNFNGSDSFTYTVSDGQGGSATASVSVTVDPLNDPPVAADDTASTPEDTAVTIYVLANDSDVDGDSLAVFGATNGAHGTVSTDGTTVTYAPASNFNGPDSFTYTVRDPSGATATATVSITVTPVNDPPVAVNDAVTTAEDTPVTISVLANDVDIDGDAVSVASLGEASSGSVVLNPDGTVTYTPNADFNGVDAFGYTASDPSGANATATVSVTVTPTNDPPTAVADHATTDEDVPIAIDVLANDFDIDGDTLTVTAVTDGASGTVSTDGTTVTYTPNANFNGVDAFGYTVSDPSGATATATVSIGVTPVNDPPLADPQSAITTRDTPVDIQLTGSDIDGDPLTFRVASGPAHGTVTIAGATATYTPQDDYVGEDSFAFVASDGALDSEPAVVSITVRQTNRAPVATEGVATGDEDTLIALSLLANDPDGDPLTYAIVGGPAHGTLSGTAPDLVYLPEQDYDGPDSFTFKANDGLLDSNVATVTITVAPVNDPPVALDDSDSTLEDTAVTISVLANDSDVDGDTLAITSVTQPADGIVTNGGTSVTYTPNADFFGVATFAYTVSDGQGGSATASVSVTVAAVNDPPVAVDDSASTPEDTQVTISVLLNDSDVEDDELSVSSVTQPAHGTVTVSGGGASVTYTPPANFFGVATFTYTVSDGTDGTDSATVTVTVSPVNDPPVALDDSASTPEDTQVTISVLANDSDVDGGTLAITSVTQPAHGMVTHDGASVIYTPPANFFGVATFTYTVSDGQGGSATASVSVTVAAVNDPPVAVDDSASTPEDTQITISVLLNDSDVEDDELSVSSVTQPAHGTVTHDGASVTYTPPANFFGAATFTYTATDGQLQSNSATVTVTVQAVNDDPVAVDDAVTIAEDSGPTTIPVLANDSDVDGGTLAITSVTQPAHGMVTHDGASVIYTPTPDFFGVATFTYTVTDGQGGSATASVSVTVDPVNDPPVALDDSASTNQGTPVTISVLLNDTDVDGDALSVGWVGEASSGSIVQNGDGTVTYTPDAAFSGTDSFAYAATDDALESDAALVTVTVHPVVTLSVHVGDILMGLEPAGKNTKATATVPILDQSGAAAGGASVQGDWYYRGAILQTGATGTTGSDGNAWFASAPKKVRSGDVFRFVVTSVSFAGHEYDPRANVDSEDSITVP